MIHGNDRSDGPTEPLEDALLRAAREADEDLRALEAADTSDEDEAILALARDGAGRAVRDLAARSLADGDSAAGGAGSARAEADRRWGRGRVLAMVGAAAAVAAAVVLLVRIPPTGGGDPVDPNADLGPTLNNDAQPVRLLEWTDAQIVLDLWPDAGGAELEAGALDVVVTAAGGTELARDGGLFDPRFVVPLDGGGAVDEIEVEVTLTLDGAEIDTHTARLKR
ncbi:MAG: hypothetical protein AAFU73_12575 [Planctomycetota bacterium]